jgi:hypothetical protein
MLLPAEHADCAAVIEHKAHLLGYKSRNEGFSGAVQCQLHAAALCAHETANVAIITMSSGFVSTGASLRHEAPPGRAANDNSSLFIAMLKF